MAPWKMVSDKDRLVNFLEGNNLKYGYANYWSAGALTVLSSGDVQVRQIRIESGLPVPFKHLASNQWYLPSAWSGETFLLLTNEEMQKVDWAVLYRYHGNPSRLLTFEDMNIIVFNRNIATDMPGWDASFSKEVFFSVTKFSGSQVGNYVPGAAASRPMLVSQPGQSGVLHFGPYVTVKPGTYRAIFDIDIEGPDQEIARIDIASNGVVHPERRLHLDGRTNEKSLTLTLKQPAEVEFRVFSTGSGTVRFRGVSLIREDSVAG